MLTTNKLGALDEVILVIAKVNMTNSDNCCSDSHNDLPYATFGVETTAVAIVLVCGVTV